MKDSNNTQSNSKQAYLIRTCSDQSPISKEKTHSKYLAIKNGNQQRRGASLGHQKEHSYRRNLDELTIIGTSPKNTMKPDYIMNTFAVNNNGLIKENEILKLRISELIKENKELKEQNALYYQPSNKGDMLDESLSSGVNKKWTLKSKKSTIKEFINDEDDNITSSGKKLQISQIAFNPPILSYNTPTNSASLHKRPEFNYSLDTFNTSQNSQKFKLIHQKIQQEKNTTNSMFNTTNPISTRVPCHLYQQNTQLALLKKRTEKLLERYKSYLPLNQSDV